MSTEKRGQKRERIRAFYDANPGASPADCKAALKKEGFSVDTDAYVVRREFVKRWAQQGIKYGRSRKRRSKSRAAQKVRELPPVPTQIVQRRGVPGKNNEVVRTASRLLRLLGFDLTAAQEMLVTVNAIASELRADMKASNS